MSSAKLIIFAVAASFGTMLQAEQPNIVLIMCDDLGYGDVGFNGSTDIRTPSLDELATQGTICTSGYVCHPFCGPSRMGMVTGRYPHTMGAPFNLPESRDVKAINMYKDEGVDRNEKLISTVLQEAGYYTGIVGKWHMGKAPQYHPNARGFDDFYGFLGGGHKYFPEEYRAAYKRQRSRRNAVIWDYLKPLEHNGKKVTESEYLTDELSHGAARFVKRAAKKQQPFFLFVSYNAPHTPLEAKQEDIEQYAHIKDEKRRTYAAMVHAVDRGVQEVVQALKDTQAYENTLIVFLSDNGGRTDQGGTNTPLKGSKGDTYEGGFRVPMFFHWPGRVAPGQRYDHPVSALDFYPTFAALANAQIPSSKALDGKNIWEDLIADRSARAGEPIYALRHRNGFSDVGIRVDQWKATRAYQQRWKLYDMSNDSSEQRDLAAKHPDILGKMVAEARQWCEPHPQPRWFHNSMTGELWSKTKMPRNDKTFGIKK